jgi:hypothetical protein
MDARLTEQALNQLGELFVKVIKDRIKAKIYPYGNPQAKGNSDKIASGDLYNSISYSVETDKNGDSTIVVSYADYFNYVNRGRRKMAKRVPLDVLMAWMKMRGITRFRDSRGRFKKGSMKSLAFAIQTNIYKYGVRPANLYDGGIDDMEQYFDDFPNNLPPEMRGETQSFFRSLEEDINNFIDLTITKEITL